jgi:hypothetical protein
VKNGDVKQASVIVTDESREMHGIVEWARRNPQKTCDVFALSAEERDRIRSLLLAAAGGSVVPSNIHVSVKPDDFTSPVHVRIK